MDLVYISKSKPPSFKPMKTTIQPSNPKTKPCACTAYIATTSFNTQSKNDFHKISYFFHYT